MKILFLNYSGADWFTIMPGTEELLKEMTTTYIGFDPTSDSLHIGSLVSIVLGTLKKLWT
jgi:tyrosyl-tRNA synthetase